MEKSNKQELKDYIAKNYDYISALDIAKINRTFGFYCELHECVEIRKELFPTPEERC